MAEMAVWTSVRPLFLDFRGERTALAFFLGEALLLSDLGVADLMMLRGLGFSFVLEGDCATGWAATLGGFTERHTAFRPFANFVSRAHKESRNFSLSSSRPWSSSSCPPRASLFCSIAAADRAIAAGRPAASMMEDEEAADPF